MRIRSLYVAGLLAALASSSVGCSNTNGNGVVVGTTSVVFVLDDTALVQWEAGIFWSVANTFEPTFVGGAVVDPPVAVNAVGSHINSVVGPRGCANTSRGSDFVTVRFNNCTPPFGQTNTSGAIGFGVSSSDGGIVIDANSSTVKATQANITIHSSALYTTSGTSRTLTVNSSGTGAGPAGLPSTRSGTYTVTWNAGDSCANIYGSIARGTSRGDVMAFSAFRVCTTGCPLSGTVTHTNATNGVTTTTVYSGTTTVRFTTSDGQSGVETISCS